jgi:FMN phosphatase YigB (HAD superfamily)
MQKSVVWQSLALLVLGLFLSQGSLAISPHAPPKKGMWVYFDLGDTLIDAKDLNRLRYLPGVREYLHRLRSHGVRLGLITNIPETWGADYAQKLEALKKTIQKGWTEREAFEWEMFDEIILPMKDVERKPAPTLFLQAIQRSQRCPSAYIGESPGEIEAARQLGMAAKLFSPQDRELFVPPERAREFLLKNYKLKFDSNCVFARDR